MTTHLIGDGPSKESVPPVSPPLPDPSGSSVTESPTPAGDTIEEARAIAGFWRDEALRNKTFAGINQRTIDEQRRDILELRSEVAKLSASRNPALAQAILEWLDSDSDQLMVEDDGEKPVRLDMLLEAIDTEANPLLRNALYRRYAKFLALVLTSHRWPVTVQGETATPPVKVTNLMAGNR
jgi:hypothetical protein